MTARLLWALAALVTLGCFPGGYRTVEHRIVLKNDSDSEMVVRTDGAIIRIPPRGTYDVAGETYQIEVQSASGEWLPYDPEEGEIYPRRVQVPSAEP